MQLLDLTLPTPEENLALDEALLWAAEEGQYPEGVLRLWESGQAVVVVGRASQIEQEVNVPACRRHGVPIVRRCSGGTAIVAGKGCLMYAVVLGYDRHPHLRAIDAAHAHVLGLLAGELNRYLPGVQCAGTSDLAIEGRKFSGNSLRCRRDHFLYHGTLLYDFRLSLLDELLLMPPRLPEYRRGRSHGQFVANLSLSARVLRQAVAHAFAANAAVTCWPEETVRRLAAEKYSRAAWNEVR